MSNIDWSDTEYLFALSNKDRGLVEFFEHKPSTTSCEECWMVSSSETLYLKTYWKLIEKPSITPCGEVYTQEMADNGVLPSVGMEFIVTNVEKDSRICDFEGEQVSVIGVNERVITFKHVSLGVGCGIFYKRWVKPIEPPKTDDEKAIEDILTLLCATPFHPKEYCTVILNEIKAGKIHNVTWGK